MFKGLGDFAMMLKQAQQMGSRLESVAAEMKTRRATGSAGGGLVSVEVNGAGEVLSCRIDPSLIESHDREMIEDLLPAAINQALTKARQLHADAMKNMAAGMKLPGLDDMLAQLGGGSAGTPVGGESPSQPGDASGPGK